MKLKLLNINFLLLLGNLMDLSFLDIGIHALREKRQAHALTEYHLFCHFTQHLLVFHHVRAHVLRKRILGLCPKHHLSEHFIHVLCKRP